ncbi:hypothetical protein MESS4_340026 [Mesorhizobium sp. STM 4661]|nr:hypothetical protein MESS4_340026 [Mesorhizobium sp. STM 4661]
MQKARNDRSLSNHEIRVRQKCGPARLLYVWLQSARQVATDRNLIRGRGSILVVVFAPLSHDGLLTAAAVGENW